MMPNSRPDLITLLVAAGALLLFASYWAIFALTTDDGAYHAAVVAIINTAPAIFLAWIVHIVLDRYIWRAPIAVRLAVQLPASIAFALTWYVAILVIRELRGDWMTQGFAITPFVPIVFAWQMFQGVTIYALAALASLAISLSRRLERAQADRGSDTPLAAPNVLVRTGEGTETVPIDAIIAISGAGDYSEIRLPGRTFYSTTTLAEFETRLPQARFFRAHRSHIVRIDAVGRSEPAGNGRTVLHLCDGYSITTSRAGTRLLREAAL